MTKRNPSSFFAILAAVLVASCGGGSDDDAFRTPATSTGGTTPNVAAVAVTSSSPTILSDGSATATITALVRGPNNVLLEGVPVTFGASSGGIAVTQGTTDATGAATATLSTAGDATLRTITVTAAAGGQQGTVNVSVVAPSAPPTAAQISLITSTTTIPSNGSTNAEITAIVRNANNQFLQNVPVTFTANSGGLTVTQATTDASGAAKATLNSAGDPTNRTITVTASSGTVNSTINIDVTGTTLTVQGPPTLALNQSGTYTITLADSGSRGIGGRQVAISSQRGNQLSVNTITTDANGRGTVNLTVTQAGNDTISVTSLGLNAAQPIGVNADNFSFTAPAANTEVPLGAPGQNVTLRWLQGGNPVVGQTVNFSTTRGTVNPASAATDANGNVTVGVSATTAGFGTVTASAAGGATAQLSLEFVATTAQTIDVQSSLFTLAPNEQATITAVVRDPQNNLVKNKTVNFTLTDTSGGTLSTASAVTDSNGRAQTIYTAGASTTAQNGVTIQAAVQGSPGVTDTVQLTVARRQVFISIGTGNSITEPNEAQYKIDFIIQVTDSNGNGVSGVPLTVSMLSERYFKGFRRSGTPWATCYTTVSVGAPSDAVTCNTSSAGGCFDEDTNRNGILDAGEDTNNNGSIQAGNIATATPNNVTTDANGFALVSVFYPQEYAYWLIVTIQASTSVQGTEFARRSTFMLPGSATDFNTANTAPPGVNSPFGQGTSCNVPN